VLDDFLDVVVVFFFAGAGSASVVAVGVFLEPVLPVLEPVDVPVVLVAAGVVASAAFWAVESDFLSPPPQPASASAGASTTPVVAVSIRGTARTIASGARTVCRT
jgi:hypothetical protein